MLNKLKKENWDQLVSKKKYILIPILKFFVDSTYIILKLLTRIKQIYLWVWIKFDSKNKSFKFWQTMSIR